MDSAFLSGKKRIKMRFLFKTGHLHKIVLCCILAYCLLMTNRVLRFEFVGDTSFVEGIEIDKIEMVPNCR